ncbi:alpha/beta fold hydrolase [Salinivibrio kushneri]|uniref:alpha/beta fold hydrolase n=1 Tax=Salinivibrio kushneri TaxID=1908198 RepID=UPI0022B54242|nr:alpha/beta hydrolase [Salinivibrio kushneri]WBA12695.1 alpha/beta hydrolase [Salinivibrio kushneri]
MKNSLYCFMTGEGPPVFLIHGLTNSGRSWKHQVSFLVRSGFRVFVPDLPGHGVSPKALEPISVDFIAKQVLQVANEHNVDSFYICGISLGGMVALNMAILEPDRIKKVVVSNTFSSFVNRESHKMLTSWKSQFCKPGGTLARLNESWPYLLKGSFRKSPEGLATYQSWHALASETDGRSLVNVVDGMIGFDIENKLNSILSPVTFVLGEADCISDLETNNRIASKLGGEVFIDTIRFSRHLTNVDSPQAFNDCLLNALR